MYEASSDWTSTNTTLSRTDSAPVPISVCVRERSRARARASCKAPTTLPDTNPGLFLSQFNVTAKIKKSFTTK